MKKKYSLILCALFFASNAFAQSDSGLVGKWTFNGNADDVSGHGLNGIIHGATLTAGINGLPNTAYYFDGISSYITVPYDSSMNTMVHSFCVLIKPLGFYSGHAQGNAIIWRGIDWSSDFSYQLEYFDNAYDNSDDIYSPTEDVFAGWTGLTTSSTPQTEWYYTPTVDSGAWYSVVLTYDGDSTRIYVNGTLKNVFYNTCTFTPTTDSLNFGRSEDDATFPFWLHANIDEIRFYNRVLSPAEVRMFTDSAGNAANVLPIAFFLDGNGDCIKEDTENYNTAPITLQVDSNGILVDTISATGMYYYHPNGNAGDVYSFKVISTPANLTLTCPSSGILYDTLSSGINSTKYIGFVCDSSSAFDLQVNTGVSTSVTTQTIQVLVSNNYCSNVDATLNITFSPQFTFSSAIPAPTAVVGNTATWSLGAVSYMNSPIGIHINLNSAMGTLTPGDTTITKFVVSPTIGDMIPINNIQIDTDTVKACIDPNEMTVTPNNCTLADIPSLLQYTIQFENTGNDTAHDIYVMDTLSDDLDAMSLSIVASSNYLETSKWHDDSYHNILQFNFPNINLLDSTHHNDCQGMVTFNINTIPGLPTGYEIANHAGVFFDTNPVVLTDTAYTFGCVETSVKNITSITNVDIFPNPATGDLFVKIAQPIYHNITITNYIGQTVMQQALSYPETDVDISPLPIGVYYVIINSDSGNIVRKVVKL